MNKTSSTPEWVRDTIFYQVFLDRFANGDASNDPVPTAKWGSKPTVDNFFGGDLLGVMNHLDYLQDVGVNALYLTPIFKASSNHKYDTDDYYQIDPAFGDKKIFRSLVDECHRRRVKVVLDGVFNHCGYHSIYFQDVIKNGRSSKYSNWFDIHSHPIDKDAVNYQTCGGTWYLPKLNCELPEVRQYLFDMAAYWIREFGIDGWRLDVPWKISFDFWMEFRERIKGEFPETYLVGEIWRDAMKWIRGDTFDGVMNYPLRNCILDYCVYDHMDAEDFNYELLHQQQIFQQAALLQLNLLGSHDTPRILTLCGEEIKREILAISFLFTYLGTPMLYYGDEIGLTGENDPDCRKCMPWEKQSEWNYVIQEHFKKLIKARMAHAALRRGSFKPLYVFNGVYSYQRQFEDDTIIVVLNPRMAYHDIKIPYVATHLNDKNEWCDILTRKKFIVQNGNICIETLDAMTGLILYPTA